jgi:hypothetical protein
VDERNRLLLTTEGHTKKDSFDFYFIFSRVSKMSYLKASIHILSEISFTLYIILSMILQLSGLVSLIVGGIYAATTAGEWVFSEFATGKFNFCYH